MSIIDTLEVSEVAVDWSRPALIGWNRGGQSLRSPGLHVCAACFSQTEKSFDATADTHHILNRSNGPCGAGLCVRCWSRLVRLVDEAPCGTPECCPGN
ncbi:hypothetical protein [Streptomyces sp. NBC_00239]|uniref:hypothetical protein n=1 Tax=Streptomyces sp. NBC_00239 TaxID=2903640 RepID=UPI002E2A7501|nr:hypothetical protein [Streptomyces sp. NBC_00239]